MESVRVCLPEDEATLARAWHDSWHIAHAKLVPVELLPFRQLDYFASSFSKIASQTRVLGPAGAPFGFYRRIGHLIDKLFVESRGKGHGSKLLLDAEKEIRRNGFTVGELQCLVGNTPAQKFYEANGWIHFGETTLKVRAQNKFIPLTERIYRKDV